MFPCPHYDRIVGELIGLLLFMQDTNFNHSYALRDCESYDWYVLLY